jgi:hypothetical protein
MICLYTFTLRLRHASQAAITGFNLGLDMMMFGTGGRFDLSFEGRIRRIVPVLTTGANASGCKLDCSLSLFVVSEAEFDSLYVFLAAADLCYLASSA